MPTSRIKPVAADPAAAAVANRATTGNDAAAPASAMIDARIEELGDWRGEMLARLRALIKEADPDVVEEWKWRGTPGRGRTTG